MRKPLCIIPTYSTSGGDIEMLNTCLRTLRETAGDRCDVVVVDDGSSEIEIVSATGNLASSYDCEFVAKEENTGFSKTVNVGLRRARDEGRDAVLVNADIEFTTDTWLELMVRQRSQQDSRRFASMVGALLIYPNGLIQHAGIFFSLLYREFDHVYRYAPANLPEAQKARTGPVTGALQFIRHECLEGIGIYDEHFKLGWEDVDYAVRAWLSGRSVVYQPGVRAIHHESFFRGRANPKIARWQAESWDYFTRKYHDQSFAEFVPSLI